MISGLCQPGTIFRQVVPARAHIVRGTTDTLDVAVVTHHAKNAILKIKNKKNIYFLIIKYTVAKKEILNFGELCYKL